MARRANFINEYGMIVGDEEKVINMKRIEEIEEFLEDIGELDEYNACPICNKKSLFRIDKYDAYCCVVYECIQYR